MKRASRISIIGLIVLSTSMPMAVWAAPSGASGLNIDDLAGEWLRDVAVHGSTPRFWSAWANFENRHANVYRASYYDSDEALARRVEEAKALAPYVTDVINHTRTTRRAVQSAVPFLQRRIGGLFGVRPVATVYLAPAMQRTDAMAGALNGHPAIFVNPWHPNYVDALQIEVTLAHELTHVAQQKRFGDRSASLPPLARMLWLEGGAVYASHVLYPKATVTRLLAFKRSQWEKVPSTGARAASELLGVLEDQENARAMDVFFHAGVDQTRYPERIGYFLGYRIFWRYAQDHGMAAALALPPEDFLPVARTYLNEIVALSRH